MTWKVELDPRAEKELGRLDSQQAKRILKYLFEKIATDENPRRFGDALKKNLTGLWKYRVGNYRLICDIQEAVVKVVVVRVGHRKDVYKF